MNGLAYSLSKRTVAQPYATKRPERGRSDGLLLCFLSGILSRHLLWNGGMPQVRKYRYRGVRSVLSRIAGRIFLGLALTGVAVDFVAFDSFSAPTPTQLGEVSAAVVFTGQFDRVDAGLHLVDAKAVPRVYISGVNGGAGINPANFVHQFSARNPNIANLQRLVECCVEWGERANNTLQNARDTECWVRRRGLTGPLLLVTSQRHMARALAALSGTLPDRLIVPYPIEDAPLSVYPTRMRALDYVKYIGTFVTVRIPWIVNPQQFYGPFTEGCPGIL